MVFVAACWSFQHRGVLCKPYQQIETDTKTACITFARYGWFFISSLDPDLFFSAWAMVRLYMVNSWTSFLTNWVKCPLRVIEAGGKGPLFPGYTLGQRPTERSCRLPWQHTSSHPEPVRGSKWKSHFQLRWWQGEANAFQWANTAIANRQNVFLMSKKQHQSIVLLVLKHLSKKNVIARFEPGAILLWDDSAKGRANLPFLYLYIMTFYGRLLPPTVVVWYCMKEPVTPFIW